jgi:hypothetical protein
MHGIDAVHPVTGKPRRLTTNVVKNYTSMVEN